MKKSFNGTHQDTYNGTIVFRMLGNDEKKMKEFHEDYKNACHAIGRGTPATPPTEKDLMLANMWAKEKLTVGEISQRTGVPYSVVDSAVRRVAKWRLRNG